MGFFGREAVQVCGANHRNLSSYAFTLMVLYFLQVDEPGMPCLPTDAFCDGGRGEDDERVRLMLCSWRCSRTLPEMMARFFRFFSVYFIWGLEVVSVRLGFRSHVYDPYVHQLQHRASGRLHVEDPFVLERNLHCVLGDGEEVLLRAAFSSALRAVESCRAPEGLMPLVLPAPWLLERCKLSNDKVEIASHHELGKTSFLEPELTGTSTSASRSLSPCSAGSPRVANSTRSGSSCRSPPCGDDPEMDVNLSEVHVAALENTYVVRKKVMPSSSGSSSGSGIEVGGTTVCDTQEAERWWSHLRSPRVRAEVAQVVAKTATPDSKWQDMLPPAERREAECAELGSTLKAILHRSADEDDEANDFVVVHSWEEVFHSPHPACPDSREERA